MTVVDRGQSYTVWRSKLVQQMQYDLGLQNLNETAKDLTFTLGYPEIMQGHDDGMMKTHVTIKSPFDGQMIPVLILSSKTTLSDDRADVVLLIHGHHESIDDMTNVKSQMRGLGSQLARAGFVVLAPEIRSFGEFEINHKGHGAYIRKKADGEFLREVLADMFSVTEFAKQRYKNFRSLNVVGHSLGGYIALHFSALNPAIQRTVISGMFFPYACINTNYHHACQHFSQFEEAAEFSDVAGLIAPRKLLVHFGRDDKYYTPAVISIFHRAQRIYEDQGAKDAIVLEVNPGRKHEINPETVLPFLKN
ncbi:MAG: alpha/beta fold hydrolase [Candidatus Harrisonbacteria bacterium]|nr:alpha/beta fold hydrolase [Candidatus Harrisonbacteria bacterium]